MNDDAASIVILSERSESKDLYLPRLSRLPAEAGLSCRRVDPMVALRYE